MINTLAGIGGITLIILCSILLSNFINLYFWAGKTKLKIKDLEINVNKLFGKFADVNIEVYRLHERVAKIEDRLEVFNVKS